VVNATLALNFIMKTIPIPYFFPAKEFWYCNGIGWSAYVLLDATSVYLHNGDFYGQLPHSLLTASLGILLGLVYRGFAHKFCLHCRHPLALIPLTVFIAIVFGYVFTLVNYALLRGYSTYDIVIGLLVNPAHYWWFSLAISQWIGTSYLLLIWLLLFNFIQAERYWADPSKTTVWVKLLAVAALYFFNELFHALVSVAYYNPDGFLFSAAFFGSSISTLGVGLLFSSAVFLFNARNQLFNSYLIPLLPGLIFLVICTSFFCMISFRLLPSVAELGQGRLLELPHNIMSILTEEGHLWLDKHQFIGTLRSQLDIQAVIVLLIIYFRYPTGYIAKREADTTFNMRIWLQFWAYNIGGWSVLGCYLYFSDFLSWQSVSYEFTRILLITLISGGVLVGLLMRSLIHRFQLLDKMFVLFAVAMLMMSLVFGFLLAGVLWLMGYIVVFANNDADQLRQYEYLVNSGDFFIPLIVLTSAGCLMWVMIYEKLVSERIKNNHQMAQLQLEKNVKELQLNLLAGKMDPHFVFNALNNIRALIREDAEKAREAVLALSDIMRMPLTSECKKIPLSDELTFVRNYIHLCKIQLEGRLAYIENIDPAVTQMLVPPMILQILIENAIKHGISQLLDGGTLELELYISSEKLCCVLSNNGSLQTGSSQQGFGFGLNNIRERLRLLYGDNANFNLNEENQLVRATLVLPLEYAP
jgi:two-component system LytT family sensor kinase